jgi:nicotinamidase-related amidase
MRQSHPAPVMLAIWRWEDTTMDWRIGVTNLLLPDNCTLLLIDHQGMQRAGVQNIDGALLINNVVGLTKTAKVFGVPTVLTTVLEERGGFILKDIPDVFPDQKPINRTTLNTWEDKRVVDAIKRLDERSWSSLHCGPTFAWRFLC